MKTAIKLLLLPKHCFKCMLFLLLFTTLNVVKAQDVRLGLNQSMALNKYAGTWYSYPNDSLASQANVKMLCSSVFGGQSLQVEVYQWENEAWQIVLVELISYDAQSNQMVAFGQNSDKQCFIGKGSFSDANHWHMKDSTINGEAWMDVDFHFINPSKVHLTGTFHDERPDWEITYMKKEPQQKCIGIQLVSVREQMETHPMATLNYLADMGYSFIETFVYNKGQFYGLSPQAFLSMVNNAGMEFYGSMVFQNLPDPVKLNEAMAWWQQCINDHASVGVKYLTTSNHQFHEMKTLEDIQRFCDYYNAIGALCQEQNIHFAIHNHTEEFNTVEGQIIYDYLIEHTNPNLVSFQTDLYWMHKAGVDPLAYYEKYPGRFLSWHIKDSVPLSNSSKINFNHIFEGVDKAGIQYHVVEQEEFDREVFQSLQLDYFYLKNNNKIKCFKQID